MDPADVGGALQDLVPGQESVTLFLRQAAPANDQFSPYANVSVRRLTASRTVSSAGGGQLADAECPFEFYRPSLSWAGVPAATLLRFQDYFVDSAGVKWVIESVESMDADTYFEARCRRGV